MTRSQVRHSESARCGGSGLLYEPVSHPNIDHRDPRYVDREYECPGCPDCGKAALIRRVEAILRSPYAAALDEAVVARRIVDEIL